MFEGKLTKVFLAMEPPAKLKEELMSQFEAENLNFRIYTHQSDSNPIVSETQLRMEMTSITPLGVVVYSRTASDFQKSLKKIMGQKIERLYQNANMTFVDHAHSEMHEDRMINEEQSYDDLNGYEGGPRPTQPSRFTVKNGTR